jgi:hypothetical protein
MGFKFLLSTFLFASLLSKAQTIDFGLDYNIDAPFMRTMPKMNVNHGVNVHLGYKILPKAPLYINTDISTGCYALKTREENYFFSDGTQTTTDVQYSSNLHKFLFGFNYDIGKSTNRLSGYFTAQAGYAYMNSKIYIEDPTDVDGCKALEQKNTFTYGGGIYSAGGGVRINLDKKTTTTRLFNHYLDISCKYTAGGNFSYVNINHMQEHNHAMANSAATAATRDTKDLNVKFVNVTTNSIHEHKVAEIYTSPFEIVNIKIGYLVRF